MSDIKNLKKEIKKLKARGSKDKIVQMVIDEKERQLKELEMLTLLSGKEVTLDDLMALRGEDYIDFGYPKGFFEEDEPEDVEEDEESHTISFDDLFNSLPKEDRDEIERLVKEFEDQEKVEETKPANEPLSFEEFSKQMEQVVGEFGGKFVKQTEDKRKAVKEKLFGLKENPKVKELDEKLRPTVDKVVDFGQRKFDELKDFVDEKIDFSAIQDKIEGGRKFFETKKFLEKFEHVNIVNITPVSFTVWFDEFGPDVLFTFANERLLTEVIFFVTDEDKELVNKGKDNEFVQIVQTNQVFQFTNGIEIENFGDAFELDAIVSQYYMG